MADTGIDRIAKHIISKGVTVPRTGENGHYTIDDVTTGIHNLATAVPIRSKSVSATFKGSSGLPTLKDELVIGGVTAPSGMRNGREYTGYIDVNGNISFS